MVKRSLIYHAQKLTQIWVALALALGLLGAFPIANVHADDTEVYTYQLTQSTAAYQLWTTPPSERVFKDAPVPTATDSTVRVYAAQNEFEPFQVVVKPTTSGSVTVSIDSFGSGISAEIYQVKYVNITQKSDSLGRLGPYPDPLWPLANGATVALTAGENTAFWFSVSVPVGTASGNYTTNVHLGSLSIPIQLHVFNFAIPNELHVASQMNFSHETILSKYSVLGTGSEYWMYVDRMKQYFIDHRLTPSSILWSGGLTGGGTFAAPYIGYNCGTHTFTDSAGIWGFEAPAQRYINGTGLMSGIFTQPFNGGIGFSTWMAAGFADNDPSIDQRPSPFCGQTRSASDWLQNPTSAYNTAWFAYVTAMQNYLSSLGYLDEAYHYIANEPQDQADYDAVAWYSRYSHAAAPNLKLMVSEEPRPEIYNQAGVKVDLWLPVLNYYDPAVSQERERTYGEESWVYFLHGTRPPYFNPITLDHPGIESKFTGWFLWKYRIRGIAYYSLNNWSKNPWTDPLESNHNGDLFMFYPPSETNTPIAYGSNGHRFVPSIRLELMRDSLEDYEYFYVLSGGRPEVDQANEADPQVNKIISGLTGYSRNSEFMYNLRRLIGLKNGGEIVTIPDIQTPPGHPRTQGLPGDYYINFQDPTGQPTANPLVVNGKTYFKIGSSDYNDTDGYGWFAPPDVHWLTAWLSSGPNELQRSILYSDWGRKATFEFDLPNGEYNVTVSVGWQGRTYSNHKVDVEGVNFVNVEATTPSNPYIVRTKTVYVGDNKLTIAIGDGIDYTMLNYIEIEATTVETTLTNQPPDPTISTAATFEFTSNKTGASFECQLDGSAYVACASPKTYTGLSVANHTFAVRASKGGNTDLTPASCTWSISPPVIISGSAGVAGATLTYTGGLANAEGSGNYAFPVAPGWTGTVVPSKPNYSFIPSNRNYTSISADQVNQNFTAYPNVPDPWVGGVSIVSDQNVVAVARPHLGSEVASYIGATAGSTTQYVPMLFKGAFGGTYNAALYLQNVSASSASLTLDFTDGAGNIVYTKTDTLDPHASKGYWLPAEVGLPNGFAGGVKVTSTQPILAVGRPHIGAQVMTYNGMSAGATSAWLPMFFKNGFGSYNTALYVQSVTGSSANLSIEYINLDGTVACTDNDTLGANASKGYWSLAVACDTGSLPSGFVGGVKVTSTQNILAVGRVHLGTQITTYSGFPGGATSAYVPMLFRNAFGGAYDAALYLQNVSGSSADVTIEYINNAGAVAATQNVTLAANAISSIWLPSVAGLADDFAGGARISSTQNVIAVGRPHLGSEITTYNGAPAGSLNTYLPMLFKNAYGGGYDAAFYVQNTSGSAASVEISFYDSAGVLSCVKFIDLAAGATQGFWMPTVTCAP